MRGACLTENVLYYAKISFDDKKINRNCIRESAKLPLRNAREIIKNILMWKKNKNNTILPTEYWKLAIK